MARTSTPVALAGTPAPSSWALAALVVVALATGLALRLWVAWQPLDNLVTNVLQDDSFYYFLTAERITEDQGISFDGVTPSNGYHPLWLFFLVPFFLLPGRSFSIHGALSAAAVLDVAAAGMVGLAVRRLTGNNIAALFALLFHLLLPRNIYSGVNGLETSVTTGVLSALLLVIVSVWREPRDDWRRWSVVTGALGGLTTLARLDSAVVVACLFALMALYQRGPLRWQAPGLALVTTALVVAPWYLWSVVAVGSFVPVSGEAATWFFKEHYYASHPDASVADQLGHGWSYTQAVFRTRIPDLYFPNTWLVRAAQIVLGALTVHLVFFAPRALKRSTAGWLLAVGAPLAGFAAVLLFHTLYRWFVRDWYVAWGMPILALLAGVVAAYLLEVVTGLATRWKPTAAAPRQALSYAALVVLVLTLAAGYAGPAQDIWRSDRLAHQRDRLEAGRYLKENTARDARVAAFNAGIIGYFSERTVFNIDGVVNKDAYDALREHRLLAYLRGAGVDYVADRDQAWHTLRAFVRPDDWSETLWGEDPNASMVAVEAFGQRLTFFGQMTVFRIVR